ncbi:hypothetical protein H5410_001659 [Solanum commersonii]|uniref:Uncharacterized protein n=1 Tax=Solanum commersonii TaxID=4109 RepID=A0A9J6AZM3_SOLCO|nr:hypothetical protein H5410_001659 [Solanum commersonii]
MTLFARLNVFQLLLEGQIHRLKNLWKTLCSFSNKYDSCFIWIDLEQSVLNRRVDTRVDEMINACNYTKGIRRSIGVPEMARYLREQKNIDGDNE